MKPGALDPDYFLELRPAISKSLNITEPRLDELYARACIGGTDPYAPGLQWTRAADVKMKPVNWLWPGLIARGKVSIVAGHPGLGKSQWSASLSAVVTTGGRFPVTREQCELGSVLMLSAEDDPADTAVPRLKAAAADLERVSILKAVREIDQQNGSETWRAFNLQADLIQLEKKIIKVGDVSMVVIDPVTAYYGPEVDSHRNSEIRALFMPVRELAERCEVAVLCITHLNKGSNADALMRVIESVGLVAAARAGFIIGKHPEDESRRVFTVAKNNIGTDTLALGFRIESGRIDAGGIEIQTLHISW